MAVDEGPEIRAIETGESSASRKWLNVTRNNKALIRNSGILDHQSWTNLPGPRTAVGID